MDSVARCVEGKLGTGMVGAFLRGSPWPLSDSLPDLEVDRSSLSLTAVSSSPSRDSMLPSLVGLSLVPPTE